MVTKIYALMDGITCLYVGRTEQELKERDRHHKGNWNVTCSRYIPKDMEWTIELIEECEDNVKQQRERYYIELLEPLYNERMPGRSRKETAKASREKHIEKARAREKTYRQNHKEHYNARMRIYNKARYHAKKAQITQLQLAYSLFTQS